MAAQSVSSRMSGTPCGTWPVAACEPAAAAVAAVITSTPLGSIGRKTSRSTERATSA
ncbi:hypothetical protein SFUMM280S_01337 [Streptomyces fumanus]